MQNRKLLIWCPLFLILGVLIGYLSTQIVFFEVIYKIDVLYTSISLSTLLVALYIAIVINKRATDKRIEKDLLIKRLGEIKEKIQLIGDELEKEKDITKLIPHFKQTSKYLSTFEKILTFCCNKMFSGESNRIKSQLFEYKRNSTGGQVKDNAFIIDGGLKSKLDKINNTLQLEIDFLILKINKI